MLDQLCGVLELCLYPATDEGYVESESRLHRIPIQMEVRDTTKQPAVFTYIQSQIFGTVRLYRADRHANPHPLATSAGPRSDHTPRTFSAWMSQSVSSFHFLVLRSPSTPDLDGAGFSVFASDEERRFPLLSSHFLRWHLRPPSFQSRDEHLARSAETMVASKSLACELCEPRLHPLDLQLSLLADFTARVKSQLRTLRGLLEFLGLCLAVALGLRRVLLCGLSHLGSAVCVADATKDVWKLRDWCIERHLIFRRLLEQV